MKDWEKSFITMRPYLERLIELVNHTSDKSINNDLHYEMLYADNYIKDVLNDCNNESIRQLLEHYKTLLSEKIALKTDSDSLLKDYEELLKLRGVSNLSKRAVYRGRSLSGMRAAEIESLWGLWIGLAVLLVVFLLGSVMAQEKHSLTDFIPPDVIGVVALGAMATGVSHFSKAHEIHRHDRVMYMQMVAQTLFLLHEESGSHMNVIYGDMIDIFDYNDRCYAWSKGNWGTFFRYRTKFFSLDDEERNTFNDWADDMFRHYNPLTGVDCDRLVDVEYYCSQHKAIEGMFAD